MMKERGKEMRTGNRNRNSGAALRKRGAGQKEDKMGGKERGYSMTSVEERGEGRGEREEQRGSFGQKEEYTGQVIKRPGVGIQISAFMKLRISRPPERKCTLQSHQMHQKVLSLLATAK